MSSEASEQVLALLKELAVLKEMNDNVPDGSNGAEHDAFRARAQRRDQISEELRMLAKEKKNAKAQE
jgi:hypothetical protein